MKKFRNVFVTSIFVATLMPFCSFSQYIPLLKDNAMWHVYQVYWEGGWTVTQQLTGDTVINNNAYKKLVSSDPLEGPFFLREDTSTRKVYQYVNDTEFLLYDFSLQPGDMFIFTNPGSPSSTVQLHLDSITSTIDPVFFNPATDWTTVTPLRVYYFTDTNTTIYNQILWVEGLGALSGLLLPADAWGGEAWGNKLLCHNTTPDTIDYHFVFWWEPSPCMGPLLSINSHDKNQCKIYPVPATSKITIEMDQPVTGNIQICITDILGNEVKNTSMNSMKMIIDVENLSEGIYFITLTDETGYIRTKKMIRNMP